MSGSIGRILAALGDDTRRTIVGRLADGDTPTATELADDLPITRQAVAKHLRVLADAGVVSARRQGRETRYHLETVALQQATDWIEDVGARWERRLATLKALAEEDGAEPGEA